MRNFWNTLEKPCIVLAPMADVTDPAYRSIIARMGKPSVSWTEFVSADGLWHLTQVQKRPRSENPLLRDLDFTEAERPIVAQLFGAHPERMAYAANLCKELGFDGTDINMGCPDKAIEKQGCGAAMIKNPESARAIYEAASLAGLPVSIKTRIGYNHEEIDSWIAFLLGLRPAALTVHLRTRKEMSLVPAHWELMPRIAALRDALSPQTVLIGNGDVKTRDEALALSTETGCDGVMIGRGIFGNPWVFAGRETSAVLPEERLEALAALAEAFAALEPAKSVHLLKKHVKAFVTGFDGAADVRTALMASDSIAAFSAILKTQKPATIV